MSSPREVILTSLQEVDVLELNEALRGLESLDSGQCWIVERRFFGGRSIEQMAE